MSEDASKPQILHLAIDKAPYFDEMYSHLITTLKDRASVSEAVNPSVASAKLSSPLVNWTAILITSSQFSSKKYKSLHATVIEYAKGGGTVIFCGQFSSTIRPPNFDKFFGDTWSLPWKYGDYNRTTFALNPSRCEKLQANPLLWESYSMKAVHIQGAKLDDAVYITTPDSVVESTVFAPTSAHKWEAPVVFTRFGHGYVGYVGDVNTEGGLTAVILAMCGFAA